MPTPSRTSLDAIVGAGADILETSGPSGLTMQAVATRVGVRAPSLYKHVANRDELLARVAEGALASLGARLAEAAPEGADPRAALVDAAHALRAFAHERPAAFRLVFAPGADATRASPESAARAVAPVLRAAGELAGEDRALDAARTFTAWASGFIAMELADAFRMGGDVDEAFRYGAQALVDAVTR